MTLELSTRLITSSRDPGDPRRATAAPIYQTATFEQEDPDHFGEYDYSRTDNPTRRALETALADAEGAGAAGGALAYASGMAAIAAVCRLVQPGERICVGEDIYGGADRFLRRLIEPLGIAIDRVDTSDLAATEAALHPTTRLILLETPSNPLLRITDLRAISELARVHSALLAVDSTMMSPALQRPLDLGADIVIHSATKFLGGHGDVTAGVVATRNGDLLQQLAFARNADGAALAPMEAWLLLRGLKTLDLRIQRQQTSAAAVAAFLREHPLVKRLHWLGDPAHPGHAIHHVQAAGPGSVLSVQTAGRAISREICASARLFTTAVSFGGIGSSISLPARMSHVCIPEDARRARALPDDLVRISVGIEDPADLIADLRQAMDRAAPPAKARAHALSANPAAVPS